MQYLVEEGVDVTGDLGDVVLETAVSWFNRGPKILVCLEGVNEPNFKGFGLIKDHPF